MPRLTPSAITATAQFAEAKAYADIHKQAELAVAMKLKMPEHLAAVRKAERDYFKRLAEAAEATGGIIESFRRAFFPLPTRSLNSAAPRLLLTKAVMSASGP